MNLAGNPKMTELQQLLMKQDDKSAHHIVWVDFQGEVHITALSSDETPAMFETQNKNIKFRLETCVRGNGYVGPAAAKDLHWVEQLFEDLNDLWREDFKGYRG